MTTSANGSPVLDGRAPATVEVRDVRLSFGGTRALDGATMTFRDDQVTALIGPNGAGKSTLINVVTGFQSPQSGQVVYAGAPALGSTPNKLSRAGLVRTFQQPRIFPKLSVLENLMVANRDGVDSSPLGALLRTRTRRWEKIAEAQAWETLERFDLAHLANHPGGKISGGQQRLLELARVSQLRPRVLMLDEPTAGVSPLLRPVMVEHITRLRQESGCAVILVEHNMAVVEALADWIHVMARGKLLTSGEMHQIREDAHVRQAYLGTSSAAAGQLGGRPEGTRR